MLEHTQSDTHPHTCTYAHAHTRAHSHTLRTVAQDKEDRTKFEKKEFGRNWLLTVITRAKGLAL